MTDIWTSGNKSQFPSLSHANTHHKSITASLQGDSERSKGLQCRCRTAQSPSSPNQLGDSLAHKFPRGVPSPPQHTPRYPQETMVSTGNSGADEAFPTSETRPRGDPAMPYCCAPSVHCHLRRGRRQTNDLLLARLTRLVSSAGYSGDYLRGVRVGSSRDADSHAQLLSEDSTMTDALDHN